MKIKTAAGLFIVCTLLAPISAYAGNTPSVVPGKTSNPKCSTSSNASPTAKSAVVKNPVKDCVLAGNGLTQETAGSSAFQIKRDFPSSGSGLYWVKNSNINSGTPFQIYADMTTDGGGWTLIFANAAQGNDRAWTAEEVQSINSLSPPLDPTNLSEIKGKYSILNFADYLKKSSSGFQYRLDANQLGRYGGIWTANQDYSFNDSNNLKTNITENYKWDFDQYVTSGIEFRMPYASGSGYCTNGKLTTSENACQMWWGTLASSDTGWNPAPWDENYMRDPLIIWYWVR